MKYILLDHTICVLYAVLYIFPICSIYIKFSIFPVSCMMICVSFLLFYTLSRHITIPDYSLTLFLISIHIYITDFDWRNTDVQHMILNNDYSHITMMPFRDITLPLYNMHPTSSEGRASVHQDCTHYCYFPQMWQSIWYRLYRSAYGLPPIAAI